MSLRRCVLSAVLLVLCAGTIASAADPIGCIGGASKPRVQLKGAAPTAAELEVLFDKAAKKYGVPSLVLKAVAYKESAWVHDGPTCDYGYGIMHLVQNEYSNTLEEASELTGYSVDVLKSEPEANIMASAALIAKYAKETVGIPKQLSDYFEPLKKFTGLISEQLREMQAVEYYDVINRGVDTKNGFGMRISFSGRPADISSQLVERPVVRSTDFGPAVWIAAHSTNYSSRGGVGVDRWVNHWIGTGSFNGAISWFQNPAANTSAHFVVRVDGYIVQMVRYYNKAWHCSYWNSRSVGIEHDATPGTSGNWYDNRMLNMSTDACRDVCNTYGMPKTRSYVVGHKEVPYASTSCPGNLPWTTYMNKLTGSNPTPTNTPLPSYAATWKAQSYSSTMTGGGTAICWVEYTNKGTATWTHSSTRMGTTEPRDRSSVFYTPGNWIGANRPTDVDQSAVARNEVGRFTFIMTAPNVGSTTTYTEYWGLVQEGVQWFGPADNAVWFRITVNPSGPTATPTRTPTKTNTPTKTPTPFLPNQVIIDNPDPGWSDDGSPWATGSGATDKYGADYCYTSTNYGVRTASWNHYINGGADYKVYAWWCAGTNRSSHTAYIVHTSSGDSTIWVDQEQNGGAWNYLGKYNFDSLLSVSISTDGAQTGSGELIVADAVMFTLDGNMKTPTNTSSGPTNTPTSTPTRTPTFTITNTATITPTRTPTATATSFASDEVTISTNKDTSVRDYNDDYKTRNYGSYNRILIGYYSGYGYGHQRAFVQFDLSAIPSNATVTDAKISLFQDVGSAHDSSNQSHSVNLYRVTAAWSEGTANGAAGSICWNDQPTINSTSLASLTISGQPGGTWQEWSGSSVKSLVNNWHQGTWANYGVCFRNSTSNEDDDGAHKFYSREQGSTPPQLWVQYTIPVTATPTNTGPAGPTSTPTRTPTQTFTSTPIPAEVIVDNSDPGYSDASNDSSWFLGSSATNKYGADYSYNTAGSGLDTASWTASLPNAGQYKVYVWYPNGANRANNAPFTVNYEGGSRLFYVDQQFHGGVWNLLGTFAFESGNYSVELDDDAQSGQIVVADAIKWVQVSAPVSPTSTPVTVPEGRAVWIDVWNMNSEAKIQTAVSKAASNNMNALICQIRYRGDALYKPNRTDSTYSNPEPRSEKLAGTSASFDPLHTAITLGHSAGLEVHAWVTVFPAWASTTDPVDPDHVFNAHPNWITYNNSGTKMQVTDSEGAYLDPGIPAVRTYLTNVFKDIIINYDIDGFQLDYVRYPTTNIGRTLDWGHNPTALNEYSEDTGNVASPSSAAWQNWKRGRVTALVQDLWTFIIDNKPEVAFSCAVLGNRNTAENYNFQHWSSWAQTPILDAVYPMCYSIDTGAVTSQAADAFNVTGTRNVFIGLRAYDVSTYSASSLVEKVAQVRSLPKFEAGKDGFAFFDNEGLQEQNDTFYNALSDGPMTTWKAMPPIPERPNPTPTNTYPYTATPTDTFTDTPTRTPTQTSTDTPATPPPPTETFTPSNTPTATSEATSTPTHTPSHTPTNTPAVIEVTIQATKDTHIRDYNDDYKGRNYGVYNRLLIGYYNGWGYSHQRGLVEFDLAGIPSNIEVIDARISLYQDVGAAHDSSNQAHTVTMYRATSSWSEGTENGATGSVCWNDQPTINTTSLASLSINGVGAGTWRDWTGTNVKNMVLNWVNGTWDNYGVMLRNSTSNENDDGAHKFYSAEQGTNPPELWIQYRIVPTATPTRTPTKTPTATNTPTATDTPLYSSHEAQIGTTKDASIRDYNDDYKARNYGAYNRLLVGYYNGWGFYHQRSLVQFDLSGIPSNAVVDLCNVTLYQDVGASHDNSNQPHAVHVYRITGNWSEGTQNGSAGSVCWNDQPTINTTSLASLTIEGVGAGTFREWSGTNLKNVVQGWINGTYSNYGLMFRNSTSNEDDDGAHKFYSSEQGLYAPQIYIEYRVPIPATATPTNTPTDPPTSTPTNTPTSTPTSDVILPSSVTVDASATANGVDLFNTIQEGVDGVAVDGTVRVEKGVYSESVTIAKNLSIIGHFSAVLSGGGVGAGITVDGADVTLAHLRIENYVVGIDVSATGSACVRRCNIMDNSLYGMRSANASSSCDARYNWWGNNSGPDDDPGLVGGNGDKTSYYLDVSSYRTSFCLSDSDGDGIPDGREDANGNDVVDPGETDPYSRDSDVDGVEDGVEVALGTNPMDDQDVPSSSPGSGDSDGDRYKDFYEVAVGTNPNDPNDFPSLGDANGSGLANNSDAIIIFNVSLGNISIASQDPDAMDVNRNGMVNNIDAMILFNWSLGNVALIP